MFPVVCGSATSTTSRIDRLADFICEIGPSPLDRPPVTVEAGDTEVEVAPDPDGEPLAFVFKTIADPYVGQISLFKVLSGTVRPDDHLVNTRTGTDERLHGLFTLRGQGAGCRCTEVPAGDIGAVRQADRHRDRRHARAEGQAGDGRRRSSSPPPVLSIAILARTQADEDKLANALHRLQEEDPALVVERSDETHQTLLRGMGETHLPITLERLARKFGVEVDTEDVRVPYRETITGAAESVEGKHKKQTGGHGQFGVAVINVEPLPRGEGFEFVDKIVGGAIPRRYIPAVEKGIEETMARGGVYGYPVVDVRVELFDGKYHAVDSSEMAFKMAGRLGVPRGDGQGRPGGARADLAARGHRADRVPGRRHGRPQRPARPGAGHRGRAATASRRSPRSVPTSEILRYAIDLRSLTGGRGRFTRDARPLRRAAVAPRRQGQAGDEGTRLMPCEECGFSHGSLAIEDAPAALASSARGTGSRSRGVSRVRTSTRSSARTRSRARGPRSSTPVTTGTSCPFNANA